MTYQHDSEAPRLGYCHITTIRGDESSMVELGRGILLMAPKEGCSQTRRRGGDLSVIVSYETS